jgi:hypothetical protein
MHQLWNERVRLHCKKTSLDAHLNEHIEIFNMMKEDPQSNDEQLEKHRWDGFMKEIEYNELIAYMDDYDYVFDRMVKYFGFHHRVE